MQAMNRLRKIYDDYEIHPFSSKRASVKWTPLMILPYYDPVRMPCIDFLHNFYLGTAKRMCKLLFRELSTVTVTAAKDGSKQLLHSQAEEDALYEKSYDILSNVVAPQGVPNIAAKVRSRFAGMKGHDYLMWTNVYSLIVADQLRARAARQRDELTERKNAEGLTATLQKALDKLSLQIPILVEFMRVWEPFVRASRLCTARSMLVESIESAHGLIVKFVVRALTSATFGSSFAAFKGANVHLHLHMMRQLLDWGCASMFSNWLYEMFNGEVARVAGTAAAFTWRPL
jgi:hypothetical protein